MATPIHARSYLAAVAGLLLFTLPAMSQQYNSNDVTPPTSRSGKLTSAGTGKQAGVDGNNHALLETGNAVTAVDLHPGATYYSSMAISTDDTEQCGYATYFGAPHAMRWAGSAASAFDMHSSSGLTWSYCLGNHLGQYVGYGERPIYTVTIQNALLWNGGVATNLHPPFPSTFSFSKALGVRNGQQVGYLSNASYPWGETFSYHLLSHAVVWAGTAASAVDLNPAGYTASEALATNGTQQGGWAFGGTGGGQHAALWSGTPDTFIDLHPAAYSDSRITALTATLQVGDGWIGPMGAAGSVRHALVWSGTPESAVDLNQYLPVGYTHAVATGVDAAGNVVGYAYNTPTTGLVTPPDAIAVVFAPGQSGSSAVSSLNLSPANVAPGAAISATVTLAGPAPVGGSTLTFFTGNAAVLPNLPSVLMPEGQTTTTFTFTAGGAALQVPTFAKIYVSDGSVSRQAGITVTPVVNVSSVNVNPVEGGFATNGSVTLSIPAQAGGATVALSSPSALVTLPVSVTIPVGLTNVGFNVTSTSVTTATIVPVSATYNGVTVNSTVTLSPAPVVAVASLVLPLTQIGGQPVTGTVTVSNFPRNVGGVVVTLTSGDAKTMGSTTVTIAQYAFSASFTLPTTVVTGSKGVSLKAVLGTSSVTTNISILPIPTITIVQADYFTDTHLFKVAASTTNLNATFTYGTDPLSGAIGTMQFELGQFKGATTLASAPALATVWSSDGGQATMAVTQKLSTATGGGGGGGGATGGGGGGGGSASTFKIAIAKVGKGTVTSNPNAATYASGTVVTLTAIPDATSTWVGWGGACSGTATTCTLTMTSDKSVTANFK